MFDMLWCYAGRTLCLAGSRHHRLSAEGDRSSFEEPALRLTLENPGNYLPNKYKSLAVSSEKHSSFRPRISWVAAWVIFCAFCNFIGWVLSALHELNRIGYAVALGAGAVAFAVWKGKTNAVFFQPYDFTRLRRRFRRPFPRAFLILALLAIAGGMIYAPSNYDALAYRLPRVMHWLAEGRWHWIHSDFDRINDRGPGIEWVSAPVIAFLRTDRWLFLLNAVSFLLLPGLMFSVFTRLGARGRVAWWWMWPLSCGYCFLLQAGSLGNDLFAVPFVLAAMDYALRSHQRKSLNAVWLSILAAGLFTGVKANTLPLGLPYVIALAPGWRLWFKKVYVTAAVCLVAVVISFLPIAYFNAKYLGHWTGESAQEITSDKARTSERFAGNAMILAISSLTPPLAPFADWWNHHVAARLAEKRWGKAIDANFLAPSSIFVISEMDTEEEAGLGFGLCLLLGATVLAVFCTTRNRAPVRFRPPAATFVLGTAMAFLVFMMTSYALSTPRLLAPYYPLLAIPLLLVAQPDIVRRRWWRALAMAGFILAAVPVIASPPRPLFPWRTTVAMLRRIGCPPKLVNRAETVYSVYSHRADGFAPLKALLPPGTRAVGLVTYDDPEATLWFPYGSLRVIHVCHNDTGSFLRGEGLTYVLVSSDKFRLDFSIPFEQWLAAVNGTRVQTMSLALRAGSGPVDWYLVRLN
jgi:hypothetical protein